MITTPFYNDALVAWLTAGWLSDDVRSVRNGDDDVPWSDDAPTLDDAWWQSIGWW